MICSFYFHTELQTWQGDYAQPITGSNDKVLLEKHLMGMSTVNKSVSPASEVESSLPDVGIVNISKGM